MSWFLRIETALGFRKRLPLLPRVMRATLREGLVRNRLRSKFIDQPTGVIPEPLRAQRVRRVRPQCCTQDRTAGCERTTRPPDMQCRDVPMPDRLLPPRVGGNLLDGKIDFDETLGVALHADAGTSGSIARFRMAKIAARRRFRKSL